MYGGPCAYRSTTTFILISFILDKTPSNRSLLGRGHLPKRRSEKCRGKRGLREPGSTSPRKPESTSAPTTRSVTQRPRGKRGGERRWRRPEQARKRSTSRRTGVRTRTDAGGGFLNTTARRPTKEQQPSAKGCGGYRVPQSRTRRSLAIRSHRSGSTLVYFAP